eukprot:366563-Chlamydomonas_euryale.AAC.14
MPNLRLPGLAAIAAPRSCGTPRRRRRLQSAAPGLRSRRRPSRCGGRIVGVAEQEAAVQVWGLNCEGWGAGGGRPGVGVGMWGLRSRRPPSRLRGLGAAVSLACVGASVGWRGCGGARWDGRVGWIEGVGWADWNVKVSWAGWIVGVECTGWIVGVGSHHPAHVELWGRLGQAAHVELWGKPGQPAHVELWGRLGQPAHVELWGRLGQAAHVELWGRLGQPAHDSLRVLNCGGNQDSLRMLNCGGQPAHVELWGRLEQPAHARGCLCMHVACTGMRGAFGYLLELPPRLCWQDPQSVDWPDAPTVPPPTTITTTATPISADAS